MFDFINPVIQKLNLDKNAKILDVGTGQGRMAIILALNNYIVIENFKTYFIFFRT